MVVLLSGNGSNLQALLDQQPNYSYEVVGVISNRPDAKGLQRAELAGIPAITLDHKTFPGREDYDQALITRIDQFEPGLVVLAGYMRILTGSFVRHYKNRLMNIHPSLLPDYKGLDTYKRVLNDRQRQHGTTVHFVTEALDSGAIIAQATLEIAASDDEQSLCKRVQRMEHRIYPIAVDFYTSGRLSMDDTRIRLDNIPLGKKGYQLDEQTLIEQL
ncbi:phosphoribosylglycinamide formyltransferase [Endozoicomonas sp. Mp262]|uniref:phosphoribosylglycinamide formyltransferase n=1 Tax=Endozoicomonas sp. Mp262 TaxID=2919499 RepID=UPI0021DAD22E